MTNYAPKTISERFLPARDLAACYGVAPPSGRIPDRHRSIVSIPWRIAGKRVGDAPRDVVGRPRGNIIWRCDSCMGWSAGESDAGTAQYVLSGTGHSRSFYPC